MKHCPSLIRLKLPLVIPKPVPAVMPAVPGVTQPEVRVQLPTG
jgi:hypothetical protein